MDFLDLVRLRQSVRAYSDKPVEREKLQKCLEAARLSPSACNAQPWRFIVIDEPELKNKIAKATVNEVVGLNKFSKDAPALVIITATKGNLKTKVGQMFTHIPYYLIDIGIAAEHFCLQAAEEGLGTCIMGWFNEKEIRKHLSIPKSESISLILAVGYAMNESTRAKNRKSIDELCSYNAD